MAEPRFTRFYERHYEPVYRFVRRRTHDDQVADIVIETFAIAWKRFDTIDDDALPWLYTVARNLLRNAARRVDTEQRHRLADTGLIEARLMDDGRLASGGERPVEEQVLEAEAMRRAFAQLSEHDQEVLRLVGWDGLTSEQAARVLDCTRGAFVVRLHRARKRLSAHLEDERPKRGMVT